MPVRSIIAVATTLMLSAAVTGCCTVAAPAGAASAATAPPPSTAGVHAKPPQERHVYRLDVAVSTGEANKTLGGAYVLHLEEERGSEIHTGANVALTTSNLPPGASAPRQDVGLKLHFSYTLVGDDLLLHNSTEMSSADELPTIRKLAVHGDALVSPGKPAVVVSVEEPAGHKRLQVTVTATKLR